MSPAQRRKRILANVEKLCSPTLAGRRTGSRGGAQSAKLIERWFREAGLDPVGPSFQHPLRESGGSNVIGQVVCPSSDRYVLVSAHFDHLGQRDDGAIFCGADDNAAAIAIVVDIARTLSAHPEQLAKNVLFVAFDAEEPPHFLKSSMGSIAFVDDPPVPLERVDVMITMDLVGHPVGRVGLPDELRKTILVLGSETGEGMTQAVDLCRSRAQGVVPRRSGIHVVPLVSDYYGFHREKVPYLFLTASRWKHWHTPEDTPDKLDYDKILGLADFLTDLTRELTRVAGPRVFRDDATDDPGTLETTRELADLLTPTSSISRRLGDRVRELEARWKETGALTPAERKELGVLLLSWFKLVA